MSIKTIVKKDYENFYEQAVSLNSLKLRYDYIFKTIVETDLAFKTFEKGQFVLDAGCGIGRIAFPCAGKGARVIGIDISSHGINFAHRQKEGSDCDFLVADVEHLPFKQEIFDAILFFGTFEFIDEHAMRKILKNSCRLLKPSGRLLFNVWNEHGLRFRALITTPLRLRLLPLARKQSITRKWRFRRSEYTLKRLIEIITTVNVYKIEKYSGHFFVDPGGMLSLKKILRGNALRLLNFLVKLNAIITNSAIGPYLSINLLFVLKKEK